MASLQTKQAPTTSDGPGCSALSLADGQKCGSNATSADGLFCRFHARQCFGKSDSRSCTPLCFMLSDVRHMLLSQQRASIPFRSPCEQQASPTLEGCEYNIVLADVVGAVQVCIKGTKDAMLNLMHSPPALLLT